MSRTDLKILYEDRNLIGLFKPARKHSNLIKIMRGALEFRPVHRLDYETQGLLLLASSAVWKTYHALFLGSAIEKLYLAGAAPNPPCGGRHVGYIGSRHRSSKKTVFAEDKKSLRGFHSIQPAELSVKNTKCPIAFDGHAYEVSLVTGRRHQIRSFFASHGSPLVGDRLYGDNSGTQTLELFAWRLSFKDPFSERRIAIEADPELFHKEEP